MRIFKEIQSIQNWCKEQKVQGRKIGLVPTMGYLHEGHLELVREARVSIKLNDFFSTISRT